MYKILLIVILLNGMNIGFVYGFKLGPMNIFLNDSKRGLRKVVTISNTKDKQKIAVEILATTRTIDANGKETRVPTKDIKVYPSQIILHPGDSRNISVSYRGKRKVKMQQAYRLIAKQLAIKDHSETITGAGIKILLKYTAALYYTPKKAKARLSAKLLNDSQLILNNVGTKQIIIKNIKIYTKGNEDNPIIMNDKELLGINMLAGLTRNIKIKKLNTKKSHAGKELHVKVNY